MDDLNVNVIQRDGELLVSSRDIAKGMGKEHKRVLRDIRENLGEGEFALSSYINSQNKEQPEYLLNKDSFILLVMNYQGYNDFKRAYIKRFNEMEEALKQIVLPTRKELAYMIIELEDELEEKVKEIEDYQHKGKAIKVTELVGELNIPGVYSAITLNNLLRLYKIQRKVNGTWCLYSEYEGYDYTTKGRTILDNGKVVYDMRWTPKGVVFLKNFFNQLV